MRTARLNVAILVLTSVVFVLQSVGYLSPAWFVRQYRVQHGSQGFLVDGRRFKLIEPDQMGSDMRPKPPMGTPSTIGDGRSKRRAKLPVDDEDTDTGENSNNKGKPLNPQIQHDQQSDNDGTHEDRPNHHMQINHLANTGDKDSPDTHTEKDPTDDDNDGDANEKEDDDHTNDQEYHEKDGELTNEDKTNDDDGSPNEKDSSESPSNLDNNGGNNNNIPGLNRPIWHDTNIPPRPPTDDVDEDDDDNRGLPPPGQGPLPLPMPLPDRGNGDGPNGNGDGDIINLPPIIDHMNAFPPGHHMNGINENGIHNNLGLMGDDGMTPSPDMLKAMQQGMMGTMTTGKRIVHVTAGLWYGRACVNSKNFLKTSGVGTEWCTVYIRTDDSILGGHKNMLEFRIEASLGLGLCLLGLLVASTACCCSRKQKTKMFVTLLCLFVSGAVMLIPVIHMIVQHGQMGGAFHRSRDWSRFMVHTYLRHDLFDLWSVVLCGCGSLLSVMGSILFTILSCRLQKQSDTEYDLSKTEKGMEKGTEKGVAKGSVKKELPINWARNNKITIPSSKTSVSTTKESLGGDDSDYYTEARDEDRSSFGYPHVDSVVIDDVTIDSTSGNDVKTSAQTGNDATDGEDSEVDFLDGVVLDDD